MIYRADVPKINLIIGFSIVESKHVLFEHNWKINEIKIVCNAIIYVSFLKYLKNIIVIRLKYLPKS